MRSIIVASVVLLAGGCAALPATSEERREVVLEYVGHEVGTVGPFTRSGARELEALSEKDRTAAAQMLAHGAQGFLVIEPNASLPNRIIVISGKRIVGDFPARKGETNQGPPAAATSGPAPGSAASRGSDRPR